MSALSEQLKNLRNSAAKGHPAGWKLMRDTMDAAIKKVEAAESTCNTTKAKISSLANRLECRFDGNYEPCDVDEEVTNVIAEMRKLSAVC